MPSSTPILSLSQWYRSYLRISRRKSRLGKGHSFWIPEHESEVNQVKSENRLYESDGTLYQD